MLLAIDTSTGTSVALVDRDRGVLAQRDNADTRGHAEVIGDAIRGVLDEAGARSADVTEVAVGMGPGPFTGLRVGIAAGRTFALGRGVPVIPVASHDAVAFGRTEPLLVVTDARRRELAWSAYAGCDAAGVPQRTAGPALAPAATFDEVVGAALGELGRLARVDASLIDAGALGRLALALVDGGHPLAEGEPLYLRAPDVTLSQPKRVTA